MAPKKNCYSETAKKKKKLIDKRLLQISLLVEDYIYEDKPIAKHEAEMYAKEVASYVDKCLDDERSLQVIEKLRRHMKGIITEQGYPVDEDIFTQSLPGTTPVYPIPDDDLTQDPQDIEVEDLTQELKSLSVEEPHKSNATKRNIRDNSELDDDLTQCTQNTEVEDLIQGFNSLNSYETPIKKARNKRNAVKRNMRNNVIVKRNTRKTKENFNSDLDIIDLCNDDDKVTGFNNSMNAEVSLQGTVPSLNVPNNEVPNTPGVLSSCSPSILTNIDAGQEIMKSNKHEVSKKLNLARHVIDKEQTTATSTNENNNLTIKLRNRKIPEESNIPSPIKDNAIENINTRKRSVINKQIYTPVNNIKKLRNTCNISNTKKTINPIDICKNKVNNAVINNLKVNKFKKASIYSDKVINDLSWIENIRYVREVAEEEYENVLLQENFWNNYMLPEKWDDNDFSYI